jgi:RNA polymerase sigma factor (sigma-70 family)
LTGVILIDGNKESYLMSGVDPVRLARLLDEQGPVLELFARQWCRSPGDIVQEAFLQLVRQPTWPENVVAWLYTVVRNRAITANRAEQRRTRHETQAAEQSTEWFVQQEAGVLDVDTATEALASLPLDEREVIVAHLWGGLSFEEVAQLVGTSSSTAHRRYQSGLAHLREKLEVPCQKATKRLKNS